jgi:hypothetical protein
MTKTNFVVGFWSGAGRPLNIAALAPNLYYCGVENTSEVLNKAVEWSVVPTMRVLNGGSLPVSARLRFREV